MESSSPNSLLFYSRFNPFPQTPLTQPFFYEWAADSKQSDFHSCRQIVCEKKRGKKRDIEGKQKKKRN